MQESFSRFLYNEIPTLYIVSFIFHERRDECSAHEFASTTKRLSYWRTRFARGSGLYRQTMTVHSTLSGYRWQDTSPELYK